MLREREMPPENKPDIPQPTEANYTSAANWLDHAVLSLKGRKEVPPANSSRLELVNTYCVSCHNEQEFKGSLNFDAIRLDHVTPGRRSLRDFSLALDAHYPIANDPMKQPTTPFSIF
ncbi:MAG: hypothetical protein M2R45_04778 [Verrucomicrobia subdivision 3 bacterium]|nr:hypothetical protein [Limisphaerales bacterium]MCS1417423.1 hypothetical protein [Limisphaerales bacterium]